MRTWVSGLIFAASLLVLTRAARGRGCVAARQSAPVIGALCSRADHAARWTILVGYRFQPSSRHFIGTVEQKQRELNHNQIQNTCHLFDFSVGPADLAALGSEREHSAAVCVPQPALCTERQIPRDGAGGYDGGSPGAAVPASERVRRQHRRRIQPEAAHRHLQRSRERHRPQRDLIRATADQSVQPGDGGTGFALDVLLTSRRSGARRSTSAAPTSSIRGIRTASPHSARGAARR